jgi:DNA-binding XRE family transcriptional regulator
MSGETDKAGVPGALVQAGLPPPLLPLLTGRSRDIPLTSHVVTGSPNRLPHGYHAIPHRRVLCVQTGRVCGRDGPEEIVAELPNGNGDGSIEVVPVVVLSQTFPARPSWIPEIRDFVRRCLAESPLTEEGTRGVSETVFRALLDAAGPTGAIQVSFRIFPEHVEVDVLHSNQPPAEVDRKVPATTARPSTAGAVAKPGGAARPATFADWMSTALRREGLTQEAAARQLGVSVKTVGRWVGGETEPRLRDLRRIQELFGELPFP